MREALALVLLLVLFGCEVTLPYSVDGERHEIVINPKEKP